MKKGITTSIIILFLCLCLVHANEAEAAVGVSAGAMGNGNTWTSSRQLPGHPNVYYYGTNVGGNSLMSGVDILDTLRRGYSRYLGTPYNWNSYVNGMNYYGPWNCDGFVDRVLADGGGSYITASSGWHGYLTGQHIESYTFYSDSESALMEALLDTKNSDLTPGSVIWFWDGAKVTANNISSAMASSGIPNISADWHHVGIYIGNALDDILYTGTKPITGVEAAKGNSNKFWHSGSYDSHDENHVTPLTGMASHVYACTVFINDQYISDGWHTFSGKKYYYQNGSPVKGQKKINGSWYYFDDKSGVMITGWKTVSAQKKTVYYDTNGKMVYGEKKINGSWYYFNTKTGAMTKGWVKLASKTVYYNSSGKMVYGEQKINNKWYYFDTKTGAMKTGWLYLASGNKTVYYNASGQMLYGQQKINGAWYYLNEKTGARITGWKSIPSQNKIVYYDASGKMVYGEKKIDGYWYYFDSKSGAMIIGFKEITSRDKIVYYDSDGHMLYGEQVIDEETYYFDVKTGAMLTGWRYVEEDDEEVAYYYDEDGHMVFGEYEIDGISYRFDEETGRLIEIMIPDTESGDATEG